MRLRKPGTSTRLPTLAHPSNRRMTAILRSPIPDSYRLTTNQKLRLLYDLPFPRIGREVFFE
jgi:hypothetical protein